MKKTLLSTTLIALILGGCAGPYKNGNYLPMPDEVGKMMKPKVTKEQAIAQSHDSYLTEKFMTNFKTSRDVSMNVKQSSIEIEKVIVQDNLNVRVRSAENYYKNNATSFLKDDVANTYTNAVKERGNYYSIYKGQMNYKILQAIFGKLNKGNKEKLYGYGLDFAIIEFDQNDQIQSALVRVAVVIPSALGIAMRDPNPPADIEQNSIIFFKNKMDIAEMTIPNSFFTEYLVKTYR